MRKTMHVAVALVLAGLTSFFWNHLLQPSVPGHLVRLSQPSPALTAQDGSLRVELGAFPEADGLQLHWAVEATRLQRGAKLWQDGRLHLEWYLGEERLDRIYLTSIDGSQVAANTFSILAELPSPEATAVLHLENFGVSGRLRLIEFEARAMQTDVPMHLGLGLTCLGWLTWMASLAGTLKQPRSWLAAVLWLGFAYILVLPGPWPMRSALLSEFPGIPDDPTRSLGLDDFTRDKGEHERIPASNLLLRWKYQLEPLRPILHAVLFFAPAFCLMVASGRVRKGALLAGLLAGWVEFSQWAMDYGFDATDVMDLVTDAAGIALAAWVFNKGRDFLRSYRARKSPEAVA
jgi:hypothetical protein